MLKNCLTYTSPEQLLRVDFERRKLRNTRYSLRSYAKSLGISIGRLSEIMAGKQNITPERAKKIAPYLKLDDAELECFRGLVAHQGVFQKNGGNGIDRFLTEEDFAPIADWEYFALMSLLDTANYTSNDLDFMSDKIKIPRDRLVAVLEVLLNRGFVIQDESSRLKSNFSRLSTISNIPSTVLRDANKLRINKALNEFEEIDVLLRDITSITFPGNPSKMQEAKVLIRKFKDDLLNLHQSAEPTDVFMLNVQLLPISDLQLKKNPEL